MTTKIGLVSDVHASPQPLRQALDIFDQQKVSKVICAGDVAGYFEPLLPTIDLLESHRCDTIIGNHDQEFLEENSDCQNSAEYLFLQALPETLEYEIEGKKLYVVHAHPPDAQHGGIKLLNQNGLLIEQQKAYWDNKLADFGFDVLIVGHTHQVFVEKLANTLVINPGSSQFNHSCMVLTLPDLEVETFALGDQAIIKCWNFSYLFSQANNYPQRKDNDPLSD